MHLRQRLIPRLRTLAALAIIGLGAPGLGCSSPPPAQPTKPCDVQVVTLNIYAADNINPNERGNTRPVVVRLYQLKNDVRMENATYDEILLKDKETLGDDMAKVDEVSVFPNDLVQVRFERIKEATVLAGVALFRSPKGNSWKTFYGFPPMPAEASCGGRTADAGPPQADPKTAFFIESTKIDNGSQFDETMFPNANPIRKIDLPKKSASPESQAGPAPAR
ncbi:Type VI secretion lipoprotein/VasD [Minicystis rosea]|nr:Type VI secretion lipoprotein/VasD [Minicystis rosea]